ncbi:hypothetical protein [Spirosoma sp.]|uniref:hypothetical protein n=1 Tax=Spirosoma sp. TaxID=1899569 RepID=UPI003B3AF7F2
MKIQTITYHKVFNLGNYQNEKIGIEIALEAGDDPVKCHMEAVKYVEHAHKFQTEYPKYERAKQMAADPMNHRGYEVEQAKQMVAVFEETYKQFLNAYGEPMIAIPETTDNSEYDERY